MEGNHRKVLLLVITQLEYHHSLCQRHTADSCSGYCSPEPSGPLLQNWFLIEWLPVCTVAWNCHNLHFPLLNFMRFLSARFLQHVEVLLDDYTSFWSAHHSFQFFCSELMMDALYPVIHVIKEDVKQNWTQYWPLVTHLQIGFLTVITSAWACPFKQFLTPLTFCTSKSHITILSMKISCQNTYWSQGRQYHLLFPHSSGRWLNNRGHQIGQAWWNK